MMSVLEYALDVSLSVEEVLKLCEGQGFPKSSEEDMLSDEEITILDSEVQNLASEEVSDEINDEYNDDEMFEKVESLAEGHYKQEKQKTKVKNKPKQENQTFKKDKKEMYKNKEKLISNTPIVNTNVVTFKDGMTISDLAK